MIPWTGKHTKKKNLKTYKKRDRMTENKQLISLNWIEQYGLQVVEKDVETPLLIVPTELFNKLKKDVGGKND